MQGVKPSIATEDPVRSAIIDSCIRVTDNGRESIHRSVFYIFTLYNASNHYDQLKLGARSSEEAARWIRCLMESALKSPRKDEHIVSCSHRRWQAFRISRRSSRMHSIDWTVFSSVHNDPMASDVIAPSPWTIFGCKNGLRLFTEAKDGDSDGKFWDDHPAIMAVGVVDANSEAVFQTVMSLGQSRSEWDFCLREGRVVEHIDGHTDIMHKKLRGNWLPWGMRKRDLLLRRYWRREDDGTYVILYHSVFHYRCHSERGYVRACLKSGGYVISPVNQGKQSVVKHMLAIDWKFWKSYLFTSSAKYITIRMLERVAALREFFRAKNGNCACLEFSSHELTRDMGLLPGENERKTIEMLSSNESNRLEDPTEGSLGGSNRHLSSVGSFVQLNDAADEFFDVPDESEFDQREAMWPSDESTHAVDQLHAKLSSAAVFVRKLHDLAVQKRGYVDLQGAADLDNGLCYGYTLPKDSSCTMPSTWAMTDPTTFLVRGESYFLDRQKIKANSTLMQMVGADWIKSFKREDDLAGQPGGLVQSGAHDLFWFRFHRTMMDVGQRRRGCWWVAYPLLQQAHMKDVMDLGTRGKLKPNSHVVDAFGDTRISSFQKVEVNTGSRSDTMDCGIPCRRTMSVKKACATDSVEYEWASAYKILDDATHVGEVKIAAETMQRALHPFVVILVDYRQQFL
ncbi:hypothetical protein GUJ93_ZPchr0010g7698 [Zizania palustris]|uniref:START domain-containing protein n=1 Tax=Zizania palustris TaxID=103762 RepID=A0A8J6BIL0_ZIZPA|nr:hypothetical protein GUJ93_ZPchr0010g7698 [Zizania palustris]